MSENKQDDSPREKSGRGFRWFALMAIVILTLIIGAAILYLTVTRANPGIR